MSKVHFNDRGAQPELKDKIWTALIIQCSYCSKIETFSTESNPTNSERAMFLDRLAGWTINKYGAVKCPPCQWKEEESEHAA